MGHLMGHLVGHLMGHLVGHFPVPPLWRKGPHSDPWCCVVITNVRCSVSCRHFTVWEKWGLALSVSGIMDDGLIVFHAFHTIFDGLCMKYRLGNRGDRVSDFSLQKLRFSALCGY